MGSPAAGPLVAAERVRQIEVDDAKRALSDAIYLSQAMRRNVERVRQRKAALDADELGVLLALGPLDIRAMMASRAYRRLVQSELDAAVKALEGAERAESQARAALAVAVRARDAVRRLQNRRRIEESARLARHDQHSLDDHGAMRAVIEGSRGLHRGDEHVS